MKTNDKVICVDDNNQLTDFFCWPNGFVCQGQVYCVSGWSDCGGLILVGFPSIFKRTDKEAGFDPKRFRLLEEIRAGRFDENYAPEAS
jgi:hypothetical protein